VTQSAKVCTNAKTPGWIRCVASHQVTPARHPHLQDMGGTEVGLTQSAKVLC
jgi:hypothetical protein